MYRNQVGNGILFGLPINHWIQPGTYLWNLEKGFTFLVLPVIFKLYKTFNQNKMLFVKERILTTEWEIQPLICPQVVFRFRCINYTGNNYNSCPDWLTHCHPPIPNSVSWLILSLLLSRVVPLAGFKQNARILNNVKQNKNSHQHGWKYNPICCFYICFIVKFIFQEFT